MLADLRAGNDGGPPGYIASGRGVRAATEWVMMTSTLHQFDLTGFALLSCQHTVSTVSYRAVPVDLPLDASCQVPKLFSITGASHFQRVYYTTNYSKPSSDEVTEEIGLLMCGSKESIQAKAHAS